MSDPLPRKRHLVQVPVYNSDRVFWVDPDYVSSASIHDDRVTLFGRSGDTLVTVAPDTFNRLMESKG